LISLTAAGGETFSRLKPEDGLFASFNQWFYPENTVDAPPLLKHNLKLVKFSS